MMWRNSTESTLSSHDWRTLIDSVNFSSYVASKVHTHSISDVTDLQTKLDDKYSSSVSRTANTVLAAPNGSDGVASFRKLVINDLPSDVTRFTDLGVTYSDYRWFVIGLFSISGTYQGGKGTSQGTVYVSRHSGSQWSINVEYSISNYYSNSALDQSNQKVKMTVRQMAVDSSMKPCTFIYNGVKYAGLAWTSFSSPYDAKVMASYAQCTPFFVRYYNSDSGSILNSEIYNSIRIDDSDIMYEAEHLFGDLEVYRGSVTADRFIGSLAGNAATATKLQSARKIWGQSFDGTANVGGTITGTNFKINDTSSNPYLMLGTSWYVQLYQSMIQIGYSSYNSIKVDSSGNLILPTSSRRIYFNGSTSDNQCIVYDNSSGRLSVGSSAAKGFNVGDLLVSSAWADYTLVPTNGIYSKGDIYSAGAITAKSSSSDIRLKTDISNYDALSIIRKHRSVKYHWNMVAKKNSVIFDDEYWHYGLIAQELQKDLPHFVKDVFNDYLTIDYERLTPIMWRGIQEVDDEVTKLKKKIMKLEMEINELKQERR